MKYIIYILSFVLFSQPALAAAQILTAPLNATTVQQYQETDLELVARPVDSSRETDPDQPVITGSVPNSTQGTTTDSGKKGNVEYNWKVEEGEKLEQTGVEPDEIDFMGENEQTTNFGVLLEGNSDNDEEAAGRQKGKVEVSWKVEEGTKLVPVFIEIDDIKGETTDNESASNDRLVSAGPRDGWPAGGVRIAVGDVKGLTAEQKQIFLATVKTWAQVQSEQDLQNFALGAMLADEVPTETLSLNYEEIKFEYKLPAKLFGFIPTNYRAEVAVNKNNDNNWDSAQVKIKFPWYAFLLRKGLSVNELTHTVQQGVAEGKKKGNVEYGWKVEEGTKLEQTGIEPDEIDFMGDDGSNQGGPALLEIGGVEGDSDDSQTEWVDLSPWAQMAHTIQLVNNIIKTKHDTVKSTIGNVR